MEPRLLFPDPPPGDVAQALDLGGYPWKAVGSADSADRLEPDDGWAGGVVCAGSDPESAFDLCRRLRKREMPAQPLQPLLLVLTATQVAGLELREDLFDDFCLVSLQPPELEARLAHLFC